MNSRRWLYPAHLAPHPYHTFPMDREAGIEAYQAMVTAREYQYPVSWRQDEFEHTYSADGDSPVVQVIVGNTETVTKGITRKSFAPPMVVICQHGKPGLICVWWLPRNSCASIRCLVTRQTARSTRSVYCAKRREEVARSCCIVYSMMGARTLFDGRSITAHWIHRLRVRYR